MFLEYIATYQTHSRWLFLKFHGYRSQRKSRLHYCKYESENDMRDILDPINPPLFPTCTANQTTNLRLQPKLQNVCDCLY